MQNVKAIPGVFQHAFVMADIDKRKVVKNSCAERRKKSLLKDMMIRK